ncbi:hypothetical protein MPTA5024_38065 [Microbispora sp. ATCC PTA-5024]|nr:hypothetical protein MPTA5024_38065 [Microbispora sp. ATCC PTA-5024]
MHVTHAPLDEVGAALTAGTAAAEAARAHRDLRECVLRHPALFPARPFDATLLSAVALANAFGSPGETAERLRVANRTALWIFAADWLLDHVAASREEVDGLVAGCLRVADGGEPTADHPLGGFLAEILAELSDAPAFGRLRPVWREELERMLAAMAREWGWKTAAREGAALPGLDEYLDNADNFGSSLVNVSHWISGGVPATLDRLDDLRAASRRVQRVLRLVNDLATHRRDVEWGDLNAVMLGAGRDEIAELIRLLVAGCRDLLGPLRDACPGDVVYLERQIGYSMGFYGSTDYWGAL